MRISGRKYNGSKYFHNNAPAALSLYFFWTFDPFDRHAIVIVRRSTKNSSIDNQWEILVDFSLALIDSLFLSVRFFCLMTFFSGKDCILKQYMTMFGIEICE